MSERPPANRQERRSALRALGHTAARARGQVTPDEMERGCEYVIPSHGGNMRYLVVSVGPKWITWKREGLHGWSPPQRVLKSGWDGPYFLKVDATV